MEKACSETHPLTLTAIANRLDLRGNPSYKATIFNAGETRFVFSLLDLKTTPINNTTKPPSHINNDFNNQDFNDWEGFNVIFEYGNIQTHFCDLQAFAQRWVDLSAMNIGSATYNDELADITSTVTALNAVPSKTNGSALNRIRTNEKIFDRVIGKNNAAWAGADWELRQFELNSLSKKLELEPVSNTPKMGTNAAENIGLASNYDPTETTPLISWIYSGNNVNRIIFENHEIPKALCAVTAKLSEEIVQYWDLPYIELPSTIYNSSTYNPNAPGQLIIDKKYKDMRHSLSLNTCQGCHAGDTKGAFTQIHPRGYQQPATYWNNLPDLTDNVIDDRFYTHQTYGYGPSMINLFGNVGLTDDANNPENHFDAAANVNEQEFSGYKNHYQVVSAFLTGRRYANGDWQDDEYVITNEDPNNIGNMEDYTIKGNFFAYDPSNLYGNGFPQNHDKKWGFNALQRRKEDLCKLINLNCNNPFNLSTDNINVDLSFSHTIASILHIGFVPLPKGGH